MSSPHRRRKVATLVSLRASVTTKRARLPAALSMSCQSSLQNEPLLVYAGSKTALMHRAGRAFGGQQQNAMGRVTGQPNQGASYWMSDTAG